MHSIRDLYRIGTGPSSSHAMAPRKAAQLFLERFPQADHYRVTLYGSLSATGRGHLTDVAIQQVLAPRVVEIVWGGDKPGATHPNGMLFEALGAQEIREGHWMVYSVGGGALREEGAVASYDASEADVYDRTTMTAILNHCQNVGCHFWEYVEEREGTEIRSFLNEVWEVMRAAIERGLKAEGVLPGGLGLARKACSFYRKGRSSSAELRRSGFLSAYALAVAEENASGGVIVTAPTCGACGVLPAVLRFIQETTRCSDESILRALATAGLIGNLVKTNASISGAAVGCQGEIGVACAMASGAAAQLLGCTAPQVEYAAEMGLEHHLGLTCDPVGGLVQIPCIERNAFAASRALSCAHYTLLSDGVHRVPFDEVVSVMMQTGHDLSASYRETSFGGLAAAYRKRPAVVS
ncbi:MAG TPA: L-serine ammonia-lyase [Candidatus Sumerlaeota bacterium]|nr:L-serine ammonia-lyase [Candidatus Sumerlaeota bacterium]HPS00912.1 L-serine ammonia-lyase [Candidatus Sumerlaeota bacterium]